jgi:hypothetical protein
MRLTWWLGLSALLIVALVALALLAAISNLFPNLQDEIQANAQWAGLGSLVFLALVALILLAIAFALAPNQERLIGQFSKAALIFFAALSLMSVLMLAIAFGLYEQRQGQWGSWDLGATSALLALILLIGLSGCVASLTRLPGGEDIPAALLATAFSAPILVLVAIAGVRVGCWERAISTFMRA